MSLSKSLIERRRLLLAAAGSTCALTCKKLAAFATEAGASASGISGQAAVGSPKASSTAGAYSDRYSHLLAPLRIGNVVLKNRMTQSDSFPRYLAGLETYPPETVINHYASVAKHGSAIVMVFGVTAPSAQAGGARPHPPNEGQAAAKEVPEWLKGLHTGEMPHTAQWDRDSITTQHYLCQMVDQIHYYGSKAAVGVHGGGGEEYTISKVNVQPGPMGVDGAITYDGKEIPEEEIRKMCENAAAEALYYKALGFDMANFHMSYQNSMAAQALSSKLNVRTDKYGGSLENRARLALEIFQAVKKACGQDFLVGAHISGEDKSGGYSPQDAAEFAKVWAGSLDLLVIRGKDQNASHPNGYNLTKGDSQILRYAEIVMKGKGDAKIAIGVNGGFQDLDFSEEAIASGKADFITMARAWICDPEYGTKAYEGRGEDVAPCLRCAECHGSNDGPWYQYCSVNPKFGIAHKLNLMIDAPLASRKVAVIGGGPAGMKAAITAAERGHKVVLYERSALLGGQLRFTDLCSFKWPYMDHKDYLIRQVQKTGVEVHLSTNATPEMIKAGAYDAVILAIGAEPYVPDDIPGAKGNVYAPIFVYGNEQTMGKNVVVIGGDQIGTDTAMHLAQKGKKVMVLTTEKELASDANWAINWDLIRLYQSLEAQGNFSYVTEATVKSISEDNKVTYVDAKGVEKSIPADNVVLYAGRKPRQEEAMKFAATAKRFFIVGDCKMPGIIKTHWEGNMATSIRSGFAAGSEI
jgi:2,4-dienoyl-CoA reductase-like NADH-dependent reductase (Old Yellow Enzyme family)/thioredoxin reductase